jgi:hypothetical protein
LSHRLSPAPVNIKLPSLDFGEPEDVYRQQSCDVWQLPHLLGMSQERHIAKQSLLEIL